MALADFVPADRPEFEDGPVTAERNLEGFGESEVDSDARDRAAAAGVTDAAYIDYDVALTAYEARSDIEPLAVKNDRDMPADFATVTQFHSNGVDTDADGTPDNQDAAPTDPLVQ